MANVKNLDAALSRLRSEIDALDIGDEVARERLERVIFDIETTLGNSNRAADDESLGDQLKTSVLGFEASHPRIAAALNELVEKLAHMGI